MRGLAVFDATGGVVGYRLDVGAAVEGEPAGSTGRAGLASFLAFAERAGAWRAVAERVRPPVQERRSGFTRLQKSQAVVAASISILITNFFLTMSIGRWLAP